MSNPTPASPVQPYCTGEDIAVRCSGDFTELIPRYQVLASGTDGFVEGGVLWAFGSASIDFATAGVGPGAVLEVEADDEDDRLFAVDSAVGKVLMLRRVGMPTGVGKPPPFQPGYLLPFAVRTLAPQIEDASYELNQAYRIEPGVAGWGGASCHPSRLYDRRQLRDACVLKVLVQQYGTETRTKDGDWPGKRDRARADLDLVLDRVSLRWGCHGDATGPSSRGQRRLIR